jgi:hypothetical protein
MDGFWRDFVPFPHLQPLRYAQGKLLPCWKSVCRGDELFPFEQFFLIVKD